jgi:hypothetical protein
MEVVGKEGHRRAMQMYLKGVPRPSVRCSADLSQ